MWRLSIERPFSPGARSNAFYVEFSYPGASGVPCYLHPGMFRQSLWPISPLSIKPSQILEINKTYFKFIADKVHGYQYCRQRGITLPDSTVLPVEKVLLFQVNKNNFLGMGTKEHKVSKILLVANKIISTNGKVPSPEELRKHGASPIVTR